MYMQQCSYFFKTLISGKSQIFNNCMCYNCKYRHGDICTTMLKIQEKIWDSNFNDAIIVCMLYVSCTRVSAINGEKQL